MAGLYEGNLCLKIWVDDQNFKIAYFDWLAQLNQFIKYANKFLVKPKKKWLLISE